jgi:hypothetical protein
MISFLLFDEYDFIRAKDRLISGAAVLVLPVAGVGLYVPASSLRFLEPAINRNLRKFDGLLLSFQFVAGAIESFQHEMAAITC